ncbi:MAG TPA: uroporphyrinogen-III C-methyltransferase [Verrucomicrobiae bacterium]|nr:uroporphyrinogen-III C-methyltransferase [Verrucomicrobiae bacterium]
MSKNGKVYLVGAGPGDAGLITVRGVECLQRADVIVYDNLVNPALLRYARHDAELIFVGKTSTKHTLTQDETNALLAAKGSEGKTVTRLKGGDPFVFGRGGEEAEELRRAGIEFEIVPGISSAIAAPAYAGIPVTHRAVATGFMVVTGHEDPTKEEAQVDWEQVAKFFGTRVILMGVERIGKIAEELIAHGAAVDTPVAMVRWGTMGQQQTIQGTLATIGNLAEAAGFKPPAVTVIGEVAKLRERLNWFERRPLFGQRIAVTRSREQASELVRILSELGADVLEIPTISIKPPKKLGPIREAVKSIGVYDWLVFTSPNGVDVFFQEFFEIHRDLRDLGVLKIATIGAATTERVKQLHLEVDLQPAEFTSEALLEEFRKSVSCENLKFLLPRADLADDRLARGLEALGGIVDDLDAYQTVPESEDRTGHRVRLLSEGADIVTFTSSSTVTNFCDVVDVRTLRAQFPKMRFVSIGPVTTQMAMARDLEIAAEAKVHTIDGLVDTIVKLVGQTK